jgi:hypothetical protein
MTKFEDLEIFDYIRGYENYKISSKGRIFSIKRDMFLKPCKNLNGYLYVQLSRDGIQKPYTIHRLVASTFYFIEDYEGKMIDHIDRNKENNNLLNLRFCSSQENGRNRGKFKNNKSGYKGVHWDKLSRKWRARIRINGGICKHLGYFNDKEEAREAYSRASKEFHGDFSCCK